jgi:hypothetical protein
MIPPIPTSIARSVTTMIASGDGLLEVKDIQTDAKLRMLIAIMTEDPAQTRNEPKISWQIWDGRGHVGGDEPTNGPGNAEALLMVDGGVASPFGSESDL